MKIQAQQHGRSLLVPMFWDLERQRSRMARTWRKLVVAEKLAPVRDDEAVAHRVRVGHDQWVFYRSLQQPSNRTVIGQNYSCEFSAVRFLEDGTTEELVTVE